jgi:hypothetical protein
VAPLREQVLWLDNQTQCVMSFAILSVRRSLASLAVLFLLVSMLGGVLCARCAGT